MRTKTFVLVALAASLIMALSACGEDGTTEASPTPTAEVSTVAQVPTDELVRPGRLVACMDMPYPPMQYFDEQGDPIGVDVELLTELSGRLGLEPVFQNSVYDTIIAALKSGKAT